MNNDGSRTFVFGENGSWVKYLNILNHIKQYINEITDEDVMSIFNESILQIVDITNNNIFDFVDKISSGPDMHYLVKGDLIIKIDNCYEMLRASYMEFALCWQRDIKVIVGTECEEDFMVVKTIQKSLVVIEIHSGRFKNALPE